MIDTRALLSDDGTAIVMLCSQLALHNGDDQGVSPFTLKEWSALARKIHNSEIKHPRALVGMPAAGVAKGLGVAADEADRIARLLVRGGNLALELDQLAASGIWCVSRADDSYPRRIRNALKNQAPAVLFGAGEMEILDKPAIGIVGSRNLDERAADFARRLGGMCAGSSVIVVSGGARGTDRLAMQGALDAGGCAVGILADNLSRTIRQPDVREFITDRRLVLLTPYRPDNSFSIGGAMGRNKIIYGASNYSIIVSSEHEKGGTWAGAVEALRAGWAPVFVRSGDDVGPGNRELIGKGAQALPETELESIADLMRWMNDHAVLPPSQAELLPMT
jgi:DNA processing protein